MPKFTLGDREFPRKGDAVEYVRGVLWATTLGEPVDDPLIHALLDSHPERAAKVEFGVVAIEVHPDDYGKRCFKIRRNTGDLVAFSFRECFKPSTPEQNAKAAMRVEIAAQVSAFRRDAQMVCALTGAALTNAPGRAETAEVDHAPPGTFNTLAQHWAYMWGGWDQVQHHQEGQRRRLTLDEQRNDWQRFHAECATLRLLSARAHRNVGGDT